MRTREAKLMRNKALKHARQGGHKVQLISKSGAIELYGCLNCNDVMDCWDAPAIVNGPMPHRKCSGNRHPLGGNRHPVRAGLKNIFSWIRKYMKSYKIIRKRITKENDQ